MLIYVTILGLFCQILYKLHMYHVKYLAAARHILVSG